MSGLGGDSSWGVAVTFDGYAPDVAREGIVAHALGPLDYDYGAFLGQQIVEVHGVGSAGPFVQTIEIDVIELQTSGMRVYECERRARDIFLSDSQSRADPFHKKSFAGAERAAE